MHNPAFSSRLALLHLRRGARVQGPDIGRVVRRGTDAVAGAFADFRSGFGRAHFTRRALGQVGASIAELTVAVQAFAKDAANAKADMNAAIAAFQANPTPENFAAQTTAITNNAVAAQRLSDAKAALTAAGGNAQQAQQQGQGFGGQPGGLGPNVQLKQGMQGPAVAAWQGVIGVTQDGIFGPQTLAATKAWQTAHGVPATGVVDALTLTAAAGGGFSPLPADTPGDVPPNPTGPGFQTPPPMAPAPVVPVAIPPAAPFLAGAVLLGFGAYELDKGGKKGKR